jgi:hypothetical protein
MALAAFVAAALLTSSGCRTPGGAASRVATSDAVVAKGAAPGGTTWAARFGLELNDSQGALRVTKIEPVSPGCVMGLNEGDTIQAVNGVAVDTAIAFEHAALANYEQRFAPWCFTIKDARGTTAKVPLNCDFAALRKTPDGRRYLCDAADMGLCGPLDDTCAVPDARQ